jgi:hypothetical protein
VARADQDSPVARLIEAAPVRRSGVRIVQRPGEHRAAIAVGLDRLVDQVVSDDVVT